MVPNIEFENQNWQTNRPQLEKKSSKLTQFVIDNSGGMIKDENQANIALVVIALLIIALSIFIFVASGADPVPQIAPSFT